MMGRELGRHMLDAVKGYVARAILPIQASIEDVRQKFSELPIAKDGVDGKDGKDVDMALVQQTIEAGVAKAVLAMPPPLNGEKGEPGTPGADGQVGEPGRDALDMVILPSIDEAKVYPRGTLALYKGGAIYAMRKTEPIIDSLDKAGWKVWSNGIASETEEETDEGRVVKRTTIYTDGSQYVREKKTSAMLYRDTWKQAEYARGDVATWGGSTWHCQRTTTDEPGKSDAWRLMVKKGAAGRDWNDPKAKTVREPVRLK